VAGRGAVQRRRSHAVVRRPGLRAVGGDRAGVSGVRAPRVIMTLVLHQHGFRLCWPWIASRYYRCQKIVYTTQHQCTDSKRSSLSKPTLHYNELNKARCSCMKASNYQVVSSQPLKRPCEFCTSLSNEPKLFLFMLACLLHAECSPASGAPIACWHRSEPRLSFADAPPQYLRRQLGNHAESWSSVPFDITQTSSSSADAGTAAQDLKAA
jgi:hypothetical protein